MVEINLKMSFQSCRAEEYKRKVQKRAIERGLLQVLKEVEEREL